MTESPLGSQSGLLLFAHGARDPQWARPFEAVAARCRAQRPQTPVVLGYLEFMAPGLIEAGAQLAAAGCAAVDVVPLFLGAGGHVRKDIPVLMARLAEAHPDVTWTLRPAVGEAPAVIDAMAEVALAAANQAVVAVR
ncbi:sirohydrochlorin chelatase [Aquabacterium sp.]|uniref:sirohydrochlorin chelatase n=1 Tax=Aquabacterium sp. TaxID=1872578 RepID=UPI002C8D35BD|nr:CbiX/SirB N-terminal domain-containing protein [Aquabacterium sp.]HSW07031.1 CbiX/SirB N-terminal domain-containing protein [Aquabacterium sp.]